MKNESGTKEDISMLDALQRLWHHKAKRKPIVIVVTFPDVAQFASTDCPFRMSGAGSSVEAVWVSG